MEETKKIIVNVEVPFWGEDKFTQEEIQKRSEESIAFQLNTCQHNYRRGIPTYNFMVNTEQILKSELTDTDKLQKLFEFLEKAQKEFNSISNEKIKEYYRISSNELP